ncbi:MULTISPECIES: DUF6691 family protein [Deefgea]|uniref:YeeE/YedE family protein n=1 Tax=Deefgea chitinilytica TaxID=570276 RepID=A0ABS2CA14_9NEIS|nr:MULTISPECIES: DUF6691 family protein [Deefgea]MBM5570862.1 YeeE/YedE family protein [Deefgea chitinilytica]MBM9888091.1 YeeE/YedE family protein [Deefgea sp. CFH1-16]
MKMNLIGLLTGLLFGLGLLLAGMASPSKVQGFLDLAGVWDPSLAFVMGGGIGVALVFFSAAKKRSTTLLTQEPMKLPTSNIIDRRLILGSIAFGIGWGIAGICPGPALVALGTGSTGAAVFVAAMLVGMFIFERLQRK